MKGKKKIPKRLLIDYTFEYLNIYVIFIWDNNKKVHTFNFVSIIFFYFFYQLKYNILKLL